MTKTAKEMTVKELLAMTVKVNDKETSLVKYIPVDDKQFIDTDGSKYYVALLNVVFAKDCKNVTSGTKEEQKAKNAEILKNACGFKAVCRDLTALAKQISDKEKGFLKMTAAVTCPETVNVNGCVSNLWVFTSKKLRENWLKAVQTGILDGKYRLASEKRSSGKKHLKKVQDIATCMDISYE